MKVKTLWYSCVVTVIVTSLKRHGTLCRHDEFVLLVLIVLGICIFVRPHALVAAI